MEGTFFLLQKGRRRRSCPTSAGPRSRPADAFPRHSATTGTPPRPVPRKDAAATANSNTARQGSATIIQESHSRTYSFIPTLKTKTPPAEGRLEPTKTHTHIHKKAVMVFRRRNAARPLFCCCHSHGRPHPTVVNTAPR